MANEQATFGINLAGNAASEALRAAAAAEQLRQRISNAQDAVKNASSAMRALRGTSDEVKKAKEQLKAKIDAERNAISAATLTLHKQGLSYEQLSAKAKKFAATTKEVGGPLSALKEKLSSVQESVSKDGGLAFAMGATGAAITAVIAVMGKLASAVVHAGVSLVSFIVNAADAARSANLLREAAFGGRADWGEAAGEQINALAKNVPTAKAQIEALGVELAKSNIGGQAWVDTLNAVTQASAALGDDAGNKLKGYIERGKQLGNFQLTPQELLGTGAEWELVAQIIGAKMKMSVDGAKQALLEGRVKLADGANALREAVERKFGALNLRKSISIESLGVKFKETLANLTKGVNLEPILTAIKDVMSVFDTSTVSGKALKQMIEVIGDALGGTATKGAPVFKKVLYGLIIGAQNVVIAFLQVRNTLKNAFSDTKAIEGINLVSVAVGALKTAFNGVALAVLGAGAALGAFIRTVNLVVTVAKSVGAAVGAVRQQLGAWKQMGADMVTGLIEGITGKAADLVKAVKGLGDKAKTTFENVMDMHSPSRVFEEYGRMTTEGYAQGVEGGSKETRGALAGMAAGFRAQRAGGGNMSFSFVIHVQGGGHGAAQALRDPSLYEQITKVVTDAVTGAGVPATP